MYDILPNLEMNKGKFIADSFSKLGINFLHDACAYVWRLPYGRNSDRANWTLVLSELRGTCSTKHALLKELMDELNLDVDLVVGIYPMNEDNTPGVGSVITEQNFSYIPEAHCYLKYQDEIIDLTRHDLKPENKINQFFIGKVIEPSDISEEKTRFHKTYIKAEYGDDLFERMWSAREACIKALSENSV